MRKIAALMSLSLTVLISGCVPVDSLNPLYTDSNVIFEPGLLGRWAGSEPDEGLRFDRAENNAYQIIMTEKKNSALKQSIFQAHLVSLGGEKYLDVQPKELEGSPEQFLFQMDTAKKGSRFAPTLQRVSLGVYLEMIGPTPGKATVQEIQIKLRPAHWIFKVELHDKSLSLAYLDDEWVKKAIQKKLIQASHLKARDDNQIAWVLTGSTAEIQQLVVHTADDPGAFNAGLALSRVDAPASMPASKEPGNP